jgi:hypothetical protein
MHSREQKTIFKERSLSFIFFKNSLFSVEKKSKIGFANFYFQLKKKSPFFLSAELSKNA